MDSADPKDFPPQLQEALRHMSQRGRVVDQATGETVAEDGRLLIDEQPVACQECARAVARGWWGGIARHEGPDDQPMCVLCEEGQATLSATEWFRLTQQLIQARSGQRKTWQEDAIRGLGAISGPPAP